MASDHTQIQGRDEVARAVALSQQRGYPPCEVVGYEPRRFLGAGAFGEVWVAIDRTTGRQVAIKFYLHRGGLDWSLLSHEVEKLVLLSADRYVVQLLDVGWESEPPYYVMEYVEQGSLEQRLSRQGRLPAAEATALVREIAMGLTHAHGKGVLHCDLKPANILLDQDGKPRLADFGQSRLSSDQTPALGTLFYMAPEQADQRAVPDARWDVYALGAIFYAMLTGHPPHRHEKAVTEIESAPDLESRLARYRRLIERAPAPSEHRRVRGVDKRLAAIIDRCLAADPRERFSTVQAVLDALDARDRHRSRRPLMVLGAIGPMLLLAVMAAAAWLWFSTSLGQSGEYLTQQSLERLHFAAQSFANAAAKELEGRYVELDEIANDPDLISALVALEQSPQMRKVLDQLRDPVKAKPQYNKLVADLRDSREAKALDAQLEKSRSRLTVKSRSDQPAWFITDQYGTLVVRDPAQETIGKNYAWRTYFNGAAADEPEGTQSESHITQTQLSGDYNSRSTGFRTVAISTPIFKTTETGNEKSEQQFLGVLAMSFDVGQRFIDVPESNEQHPWSGPFAALVQARDKEYDGVILQHPLIKKLLKTEGTKWQNRLAQYTVPIATLENELKVGDADYHDPLGKDKDGADYRQRYLAAQAPIEVQGRETGWYMLVQDSYDSAIGQPLAELRDSLLISGAAAFAMIGLVIAGMWWFVWRMSQAQVRLQPAVAKGRGNSADTLPLERR
jgi:eukaryotic-like serine/threonine-protein kinase